MTANQMRRIGTPDEQVLDAADQFEKAAEILRAQGIASGVLLALLNTSVMAVELYLKSLSSEAKEITDKFGTTMVYASPLLRKHPPSELLNVVPADILAKLEREFVTRFGQETLNQRCAKYDELFMASRYPFSADLSIDGVVMRELHELVIFLKTFVHALEKGFRIVPPQP